MPQLQMRATCSSEPRIVGAARVCADFCWLPVSEAQPAHGAAKLGRFAMENAAAIGAEGLKRHLPHERSQYSPSWPTKRHCTANSFGLFNPGGACAGQGLVPWWRGRVGRTSAWPTATRFNSDRLE